MRDCPICGEPPQKNLPHHIRWHCEAKRSIGIDAPEVSE